LFDDTSLHALQQRAHEVLRGVTDSNHLMTVSGDVVLSFWCVRQRGRVRVFPLGNPVYLVVYEVVRAGGRRLRKAESVSGVQTPVRQSDQEEVLFDALSIAGVHARVSKE
jgi:hypothetical protein